MGKLAVSIRSQTGTQGTSGDEGFVSGLMAGIRRIRGWNGALLALLLCFALTPASAQKGGSTRFDHFKTGFPLTGGHLAVDCISCHINGRLQGTPRACAACHNGTVAPGKA